MVRMSYVIIDKLEVGYEGRTIAGPMSFRIDKGEYLCIVGENGAGKSTFMKTLLGLNKPVAGEIRFGDELKASEIGYLPQQTAVQKDFPATVREIVLSGCQGRCGLRPFYNSAEKKLCADNLERMGIAELADRSYRELSGGQQQRVLLARALCATEKVLLLDEPVSGLDPKATAGMYALIKGLNKEGITIIMITHDITTAIHECSHVLHIGNDIFYGTCEEYIAHGEGNAHSKLQKEGRI